MDHLSKRIWIATWMTGLIGFSAACHRDMYDQPRYEPLEPSDFFADGRSARPLPAGAVPYLQLPIDTPFQTGRSKGALVEEIPVPVSLALLKRGQERFNIY